jgi:murein L,D-transpeptidase YcbB/YkuD
MTGIGQATSWRALAAAAFIGLGLGTPALAQDDGLSLRITAFKQAIAETVGGDEGIAAFYRARDFEPLWTGASEADRARRLALIEAFSLADAHGLPQGRYDADRLMARMAEVRDGRSRGALEIELTRTFLQFAHDLQSGVLEPNKAVPLIKRKAPRRPAEELLAALATQEPAAVFRSLVPAGPEYTRLMQAKLRLERRIEQGGWGQAVPSGSLEPGDSGAAVVALRDRLVAMGYMQASLSADYDVALENAVRAFQTNHGLAVDGVAGSGTMRAINISPEERLQSIMVAMERERWLNLPEGRGDRHVLVNLVDYHAQIIDDDKLTFETKSVIGHQDADRQTPEFSDEMDHMVINPSWYVPRSIVVGEYLPLLRSNPYSVGHLEITDSAGRVVNRGRGFSQYSASSFPFNMRQPPGPKNALGSVKFMFPNRYNIYLHDTPAQHLFSREQRTYSHGCIRLDDPHDFAYALLARQETDPEGYFHRILNTRQETRVNLEQPVPVHLIYRTAFTRAKGPVNFRPDVYGRDAAIWRALSNEGVVLPAGRS